MQCAWKELLSILPSWMRAEVDRQGKTGLQELRLRLGLRPELVMAQGNRFLSREVGQEELNFCVNAASRYSPWAAATIARGFLTAPGGHRMGLCGEAVCQNGQMTGIRNVTSLCIRVARDFPGIAEGIPTGSVLLLGAPGWGKTTLLRDLIRRRSDTGNAVAVVDERGEMFPVGFARGKRTDVLTGCSKAQGIPALLRTMGPSCLAVDEITEEADTLALLNAHGCGVSLLATAHASSMEDFRSRRVYEPLLRHKVFHTAVVLRSDKTWVLERMT